MMIKCMDYNDTGRVTLLHSVVDCDCSKEPAEQTETKKDLKTIIDDLQENKGYDEDVAQRIAALSVMLEIDVEEVNEASYGTNAFEAERSEFLVLTDDEADQVWDEQLDSYLDDCVLGELSEMSQRYFDQEQWKNDARQDGRGHSISGYDGEEHEIVLDGIESAPMFFVYQTN